MIIEDGKNKDEVFSLLFSARKSLVARSGKTPSDCISRYVDSFKHFGSKLENYVYRTFYCKEKSFFFCTLCLTLFCTLLITQYWCNTGLIYTPALSTPYPGSSWMPNASTALLTTSLAVVSCKTMTKDWYENLKQQKIPSVPMFTMLASRFINLKFPLQVIQYRVAFYLDVFEGETQDLYNFECKYLTAASCTTKTYRRGKLSAYISRKFSRQIMWSLIRLFSFPGGRDKKAKSTVSRLQLNKPLERPWQRETKQNKSHYRVNLIHTWKVLAEDILGGKNFDRQLADIDSR